MKKSVIKCKYGYLRNTNVYAICNDINKAETWESLASAKRYAVLMNNNKLWTKYGYFQAVTIESQQEETYILNRDYTYTTFQYNVVELVETWEEVQKKIDMLNLAKVNEQLYYSNSNDYFYTVTKWKDDKKEVRSLPIAELLQLRAKRRIKNIELVNTHKLAKNIIGVCLDICLESVSGNSATTHLENFMEDFPSLKFNDETFNNALYNTIMKDKRVIDCGINELGDNDINVIFNDSALMGGSYSE